MSESCFTCTHNQYDDYTETFVCTKGIYEGFHTPPHKILDNVNCETYKPL